MKKILIVDDDVLSLNLLAASLSQQPGYAVFKASSGLEAIELCRQSPPDLAILDVEMPGLSGIDVAAVLRTNLDIPFVFLSAHGEDEIVSLAAESGALGYIVKPVEADQLVPAIEVALKRASETRTLLNERTNLANALGRDQDVSMATGILMVLHGLSRKPAFELLRSTARNNRVKLGDLAIDVISGKAIAQLSPGFAQQEKTN